MAQCKECGDVFGVTEMNDGVCQYCKTGKEKPTIAVKKETKSYLTDEEKAKIIEEENLRAQIRNKNDPIMKEYRSFAKTYVVLLLVFGIPALYLIFKTS